MKNTEHNEMIAKFMGMTKGNPNDERWKNDWFDDKGAINFQRNEKLLFDNSWDWLIPVIQKIDVVILAENIKCSNGLYDKINTAMSSLKLQPTYNAVVEFIKQYNSTHP